MKKGKFKGGTREGSKRESPRKEAAKKHKELHQPAGWLLPKVRSTHRYHGGTLAKFWLGMAALLGGGSEADLVESNLKRRASTDATGQFNPCLFWWWAPPPLRESKQ
jgi:hypothetical protein